MNDKVKWSGFWTRGFNVCEYIRSLAVFFCTFKHELILRNILRVLKNERNNTLADLLSYKITRYHNL